MLASADSTEIVTGKPTIRDQIEFFLQCRGISELQMNETACTGSNPGAPVGLT